MSKKTFYLPDLGEGLPDAEIVEWLAKVGDTVMLDQPLVSMETAKAVVEVPSPFSGKLLRVSGGPGDVITTGAWLVEMELDESLPQRAEAADTGHSHGHGGAQHAPPPMDAPAATIDAPEAPTGAEEVTHQPEPTEVKKEGDAGTVVGAMQSSDAIRSEAAISVGGVKAMPAVRALANKLGV
jgi:pyruvate dehydrogenase E2 component (dihydrolipoamide acetyltransferase)